MKTLAHARRTALVALLPLTAALVFATPARAQSLPDAPWASAAIPTYASAPPPATVYVDGPTPGRPVVLAPYAGPYAPAGLVRCETPCVASVPPGRYTLRVGQQASAVYVVPGAQQFTAFPRANPAAWIVPTALGGIAAAGGLVSIAVGWVMSDPICIDWSLYGTGKCVGPGPAHPTADHVMLAGAGVALAGVATVLVGLLVHATLPRGGIERSVSPTLAPVAGGAVVGLAGAF